jgi:hypothetical protein
MAPRQTKVRRTFGRFARLNRPLSVVRVACLPTRIVFQPYHYPKESSQRTRQLLVRV